jgi:hypothetical protein
MGWVPCWAIFSKTNLVTLKRNEDSDTQKKTFVLTGFSGQTFSLRRNLAENIHTFVPILLYQYFCIDTFVFHILYSIILYIYFDINTFIYHIFVSVVMHVASGVSILEIFPLA